MLLLVLRTNERLATAFPLIVISLSQGELSRDQACTEQFSSPPIQEAPVFSEAKQLNGWKTTKTDRQAQKVGQTDKHDGPERTVQSRTLKLTDFIASVCVGGWMGMCVCVHA